MSDAEEFKPFTVSSLTTEIKGLLEHRFTRIYVEAEISGLKRYPSGHVYFTLKDEGASIQAVMFASAFERCKVKSSLKDGAKVLVYANVSVYPPRGNYQLTVLAARLTGEGDLMQRYLELKAKLEAEGLFSSDLKKTLPKFPRRLALITSEAGAVVHDMCTVISRRFPAVEIRLYPCSVQGVDAPATIIEGLNYFNSVSTWRADVIIVARGGGSFEDLFCFNDEALVRAIASSEIPVVSAVGHETDFTLCDFAADYRAGTPSIAAEMVVPRLDDIHSGIALARQQLAVALRNKGEYLSQRLDYLSETLTKSLCLYHERLSNRLTRARDRLVAYSPYGVLQRGYSLTTDISGRVISDNRKVKKGDKLLTRLAVGEIISVAE